MRRDFEQFCRRMRLKWYFRNEPTPYFKEIPVLEVFWSQTEKEIFELAETSLGYSNFSN